MKCIWRESIMDYNYKTKCGEAFNDPYDFIYCPYCGRKIKIKRAK